VLSIEISASCELTKIAPPKDYSPVNWLEENTLLMI